MKNLFLALPVRFLPEEVFLLQEKGLARVVSNKNDIQQSDIEKYEKFQTILLEHEQTIYKNNRIKQLEGMIDNIVQGKRKYGDKRSKEEILLDEMEKTPKITKENMIWPLLVKPLSVSSKCVFFSVCNTGY